MTHPHTPHRSISRLASVKHALRGFKVLWAQPNARIHCAVAVLVMTLGWLLNISSIEWLAVIVAITIVIATEALNTAIELIVDLVSPQWQPLARDVKDVAAAAVLITSLGAAAIGFWVFVPYF